MVQAVVVQITSAAPFIVCFGDCTKPTRSLRGVNLQVPVLRCAFCRGLRLVLWLPVENTRWPKWNTICLPRLPPRTRSPSRVCDRGVHSLEALLSRLTAEGDAAASERDVALITSRRNGATNAGRWLR